MPPYTYAPATPKMRPEIKERWLNALRSGDYKQGQGYLQYQEGGEQRYCCLGVLCELAVQDGIVSTQSVDPDRDGMESLVRYDDRDVMPPRVVVQWAFEGELPAYFNNVWKVPTPDRLDARERIELAALNDDHSFSFEQIANAIETGL